MTFVFEPPWGLKVLIRFLPPALIWTIDYEFKNFLKNEPFSLGVELNYE